MVTCHIIPQCHMSYHMGWLRLVGSLKLQVSFAKKPYKRDYNLQQRRIILRRLLIVATSYPNVTCHIIPQCHLWQWGMTWHMTLGCDMIGVCVTSAPKYHMWNYTPMSCAHMSHHTPHMHEARESHVTSAHEQHLTWYTQWCHVPHTHEAWERHLTYT